jgi:hypothetical protein
VDGEQVVLADRDAVAEAGEVLDDAWGGRSMEMARASWPPQLPCVEEDGA